MQKKTISLIHCFNPLAAADVDDRRLVSYRGVSTPVNSVMNEMSWSEHRATTLRGPNGVKFNFIKVFFREGFPLNSF